MKWKSGRSKINDIVSNQSGIRSTVATSLRLPLPG